MKTLLFLLLSVVWIAPTSAVKRGDFKTCDQSGICKRIRALADRSTASTTKWESPYHLSQPKFSQGVLKADIANNLFSKIQYSLEIRFQSDGVARIIMDEVNGLRQRYNETGSWAVQVDPVLDVEEGQYKIDINSDSTTIVYAQGRHRLVVEHHPLLLTFYRDDQPHIVINERGLFNMEHFRLKSVGVAQEGEEGAANNAAQVDAMGFLSADDEEGMWEETFSGARDSKPKGAFRPRLRLCNTQFTDKDFFSRS
jgi:alpha 1,3-glucosidase